MPRKKKTDTAIGVGLTAKQMRRKKPINADLLVDIDPLTPNQEKFFEEYDALADADPRWSNEAGGLVTDRFNAENQRFETVSVDTGEVVAEEDRSFTFDDMKDLYPEQYVKTVSTFDKEAGDYVNQLENKNIYETSKTVTNLEKKLYGNENQTASGESLNDNIWSSIVDGAVGVVDSINNIGQHVMDMAEWALPTLTGTSGELLVESARDEDGNLPNVGPISDNLVKYTNTILAHSADNKTEMHRSNVKKFEDNLANAESNLDKAEVIQNDLL